MRELILALVCGFVSGCGPQAFIDMGELEPEMTMKPRIVNIEYLGQSKVSSQVLLFELEFDDADGDVDDGFVDIYVGQNLSKKTQLALKPLMLQALIAPKATSGRFPLPIQVIFDNTSGGFSRTRFSIGLQLRDQLGHASNFVTVRFKAEFQ